MALTEEGNGLVMPVQPMGGYGNYGMPVAYPMMGGFGSGFGGDLGSIIVLFLIVAMFGGGFGNGFGGGYGGNYDFPWLMTGQQNINTNTNNGFRDAMINDNITSVRDGISALSTQLCGCCGDMQMALANGFAGVEQGANARQMANMQTAFDLSRQIADGTSDARLASCQTQNVIQNEGSSTRFADAQNTRDIIESQTRGTQAILDKLCALELDGVKGQLAQAQRENVGLQNALNMATLRESQTAQNAFIQQGLTNEVDALYNRLSNCPVPTTPVYGRTPIFTCNGNNGCGCGCGGNF